jgi:hypothetical protein
MMSRNVTFVAIRLQNEEGFAEAWATAFVI